MQPYVVSQDPPLCQQDKSVQTKNQEPPAIISTN